MDNAAPRAASTKGSSASFNRLAWANLAAHCAEQIVLAAVPLFVVLQLGAGVGTTGLIHAAQTLPFLLAAIPLGLLADRHPRRRVMLVAELVRAATIVAILLLAVQGGLGGPALALLGFIGACGTVAFSVAAPALLPALVPTAGLAQANARIELARTLAIAAGPAAGGALVGWTGAPMAFVTATVLSLGAAAILAAIREPDRAPPPSRRPMDDVLEGLSFVRRHALLWPVFLTQFVFGIAVYLLLAAFVVHAVENMGLSPATIGLVMAGYGAGMVAGALAAPQAMRRWRFGALVAFGPVSGLVASVLMVATVALPSPWLAALSFFLLGFGPILWVIGTTTLRQTVTPPHLLGRAAAINILAYGARPLGAGLAAAIGARYGAAACLGMAVLVFAVQAGIILASPVVRLQRLPGSALG